MPRLRLCFHLVPSLPHQTLFPKKLSGNSAQPVLTPEQWQVKVQPGGAKRMLWQPPGRGFSEGASTAPATHAGPGPPYGLQKDGRGLGEDHKLSCMRSCMVGMLASPQLGIRGLLLWNLATSPAAPFCQAPSWPPHLQPSFKPPGFCSCLPLRQ